jgi:hypothetical protein
MMRSPRAFAIKLSPGFTLGNRHERTLIQIKRRVRPGGLDLDQS